MNIKRTLTHTFLIGYLVLTSNAFVFTMTRWRLPGIPQIVFWQSYAMMAPWQGYPTMNEDLLAEGKRRDGAWEHIDLDPYSPMILGNRIMHRRLMSFRNDAQGEFPYEKYRELAKLLKKLEAKNGRAYEAVRLTWQEWPVSSEGWEANRKTELINNYFLAEVP